MTGGILFVPAANVQDVDMTVDGLMSIYLSMGITAPQFVAEDGEKAIGEQKEEEK